MKLIRLLLLMTAVFGMQNDDNNQNESFLKKQKKKLILGGVMVAGCALYLYSFHQGTTINEACVAYQSNDKLLLDAITKTVPVGLYMVSGYCTNFTKALKNLCVMNKAGSVEIKKWAAENSCEKMGPCSSRTNSVLSEIGGQCLAGKVLKVDGSEIMIEKMSRQWDFPKSEFDLHNGMTLAMSRDFSNESADSCLTVDGFLNKFMKTLNIKKASFEIEGKANFALAYKSFASYKDDLAIVIDYNSYRSYHYPLHGGKVYGKEWMSEVIPEIEIRLGYGKRKHRNYTQSNVEAWVRMMEPAIQQYVTAIENKVLIPQGHGYLFAAKGSPHNVNGEPSVFVLKTDYSPRESVDDYKNFDYVHPSECPCNPKFYEEIRISASALEQLSFKTVIEDLVDLKRKGEGFVKDGSVGFKFVPELMSDGTDSGVGTVVPVEGAGVGRAPDDAEFIKIVAAKSKERLLQLLKEKNIEPLRCTNTRQNEFYPARLDNVEKLKN